MSTNRKKSLGQHFLTSPQLAEKIVRLSGVGEGDTVLEIGPGRGILTRALSAKVRHVVAVEKDRALAHRLRETFHADSNVVIVEGDILEVPLESLLEAAGPMSSLKVVANLPYNIGSQVLFRLVDWRERISEATVMLQREVAARLVAPPGSRTYGLLTVLLGLWMEGKIVMRLPPGAFSPAPKVASAVVHLKIHAMPLHNGGDRPDSFDRVVRAAFRARRKILRNTLSGPHGLGLSPDAVVEWLRGAGIDPQSRAETLSIEQYARLARCLPG